MQLLTRKLTSKLASHFECNGINIVSKQSIADEFNNLFVDVGYNLAKMITVADNAASIYMTIWDSNVPTPCLLTRSVRTK